MKLSAVIASTLIACAAMTSPAWAACSYPKAPDKIPDGTTATKDDMVAAQKLVKQYNTDMEAYLSCIKLEYDGQLAKYPADATPEQAAERAELEKRQVQKHNAAIDELESVAGRFNEQVKAFKAKNAG